MSTDSNGQLGNDYSEIPSISDDLRYIAFESVASNLVPGDTNGRTDCFVKDRQTGITERVNVDSNGLEGNHGCYSPSISADGRYVAFPSGASNLVPNDTNGAMDVFLHDRETGVTERVSVDSTGQEANGSNVHTIISADGRYVAFYSTATNLVPGDTNGTTDVFVHDRVTGITERVSVDSSGQEANGGSGGPSISSDGRYVAFGSAASNLVPGDTNGTSDVFVHDRVTGLTERVSVDSNGQEANGLNRLTGSSVYETISGDGRYVVFISEASNLVTGDTNGIRDIFVHDRVTGMTERVNVDNNGEEANGLSINATISADGRYVAFDSYASNLVPGDTNASQDVFVRYLDNDGDGFTLFDDCNDDDASVYPGAPEVKHDGIDQDCNGYDLTIDIIEATYKISSDRLTVIATSTYNETANLELIGYGPMDWTPPKLRWKIDVKPAGGNPGSVTVSGPEGSETATVTAQ